MNLHHVSKDFDNCKNDERKCLYSRIWKFGLCNIAKWFEYSGSISIIDSFFLSCLNHIHLLLQFLVYHNTALFATFLYSSVRSSNRHGCDISTFLDDLMVWTMKTIYFLNTYHLGWLWLPYLPFQKLHSLLSLVD